MEHGQTDAKKRGWKHWFWMALCCVPMIAIVVLLVLGIW